MSARHRSDDNILLSLLKLSPFERRSRGGWRFGARRISDQVAARLVASGRAEIIGRRLQLIALQAIEAPLGSLEGERR